MDLPSFSKGQPLLAAELNRLAAQVRANRVTTVYGGRVEVTPGGTSILIDPPIIPSVDTFNQPFQILVAPPEETPEPQDPQFYVEPESWLLKDANESVQEINPVNTGYTPFSLTEPPGVVFIKVEFDPDMIILGAWQEDGTLTKELWPDYPKPVERDKDSVGVNYLRQKYLRIAIAEWVEEFDDVTKNDKRPGNVYTMLSGRRYKIIQLVNTDLVLQWQILDGLAAKLAVPWKGASRCKIPVTP